MTIPSETDNDAQLIARTRSGDMTAYDELYRRHVDDASKVARIVTDGSDEAQDVVAEAFTRVLTRLREGGGPEEELAPYLRTVVRRLAIDRHRHNQREGHPADPTLLDVLPTADDPMARATDRALVRDAFETLPDRWQQVLWHTEIEGRSPASLASGLGTSPNAVAALAYRAREGLRQAYLAVNLSTDIRPECRPYAPKIAAYVRSTLPESQSQAVTAHIGDCTYCRERRDELLLLVSDLRGALWPALLLPATVGAGAVAAAGAGAAGGGLLAWLSPARLASKGGRAMATSAGVVAAGIIAAAAYVMVNDDAAPPPVAAPTSSEQPDDPADQSDDPPPDQPDQESSEPPADEPPPDPPPPSESPSPSPAPSESPSASPSPFESPSPSESPSESPTAPPSESPSASPTPTQSPSPTPSPTDEPDEPPMVDEPPDDSVIVAGESVTLRARVSGNPPPTLQWQTKAPGEPPTAASAAAADTASGTASGTSSGADDAGWADVVGATSDELTLPAIDSSYDGRQYRVRADNALGTVYTEPAVLSVHYPPEISTQPRNSTADIDDDVTLEATAAANPAITAARWESRASGDDAWQPVSGGVTGDGGHTELTVADIGFDDHGTQYRAVFTSELGTTPSRPAELAVQAPGQLEIYVLRLGLDHASLPTHVVQCVQPTAEGIHVDECDQPSTWRYDGDHQLRWPDGRCLTAASTDTAIRTLSLRDCTGRAAQRWDVDIDRDGKQRIENGLAGPYGPTCLDVRGGAFRGGEVIAYSCHIGPNQLFRYTRP